MGDGEVIILRSPHRRIAVGHGVLVHLYCYTSRCGCDPLRPVTRPRCVCLTWLVRLWRFEYGAGFLASVTPDAGCCVDDRQHDTYGIFAHGNAVLWTASSTGTAAGT